MAPPHRSRCTSRCRRSPFGARRRRSAPSSSGTRRERQQPPPPKVVASREATNNRPGLLDRYGNGSYQYRYWEVRMVRASGSVGTLARQVAAVRGEIEAMQRIERLGGEHVSYKGVVWHRS